MLVQGSEGSRMVALVCDDAMRHLRVIWDVCTASVVLKHAAQSVYIEPRSKFIASTLYINLNDQIVVYLAT